MKRKIWKDSFCTVCGKPNIGNLRPPSEVDTVACVCHLANAKQEWLIKAREKATELELVTKVTALDMFIIPKEDEDGQTRPRPRSSITGSIYRKRGTQPVRRKPRHSG